DRRLKMTTSFHGGAAGDVATTGYDYLYGGDGNDYLASDPPGHDVVEGGRGDDKVYVDAPLNNGYADLYGGDGNDVAVGDRLADKPHGGRGNRFFLRGP